MGLDRRACQRVEPRREFGVEGLREIGMWREEAEERKNTSDSSFSTENDFAHQFTYV